jgi:hypothetical protein
VEEVQRQVFDVVAVSVATALPELQTSEQRSRKFQLRILRQAIERDPEELQLIMTEVPQLPQKSGGAGAPTAAHLSLKHHQRIQACLRPSGISSWSPADAFQGGPEGDRVAGGLANGLIDDEPVVRPTGTPGGRRRGIVDLVLSRRVPTPFATELHHLVIKLKAPKKLLAGEVTQQIKSYAYAVSDDEQFKGVQATWTFWLVGNDFGKFVERELDNGERRGVLQRASTLDDLRQTLVRGDSRGKSTAGVHTEGTELRGQS